MLIIASSIPLFNPTRSTIEFQDVGLFAFNMQRNPNEFDLSSLEGMVSDKTIEVRFHAFAPWSAPPPSFRQLMV